jgi:hypothetical protein
MVGNNRVAVQLVASRVVLSPIELVMCVCVGCFCDKWNVEMKCTAQLTAGSEVLLSRDNPCS